MQSDFFIGAELVFNLGVSKHLAAMHYMVNLFFDAHNIKLHFQQLHGINVTKAWMHTSLFMLSIRN